MKSSSHARGFTLVEIMVVVLIIAILAMMARAAVQRIFLRSRASTFMNDCRVFSEAFNHYAQEKGTFPPNQTVANTVPPNMTGYVNAPQWLRTTPLGGSYTYNDITGTTSLGVSFHAAIVVTNSTMTMAQHTQIDKWIDDGNLTSGYYQVTDAGFTAVYVIEK